jgi:glycosyltransferase involved in cell wall biosynthesis
MTAVVWVYSVMRNEAEIIEYWLRHYSTFCSRMIIFDDHSTDGTPEIARAAGAEIRAYPFDTGLDDIDMVSVANDTYREARGFADWVIWVDADEILHHPSISQRLTSYSAAGIAIPRVEGYVMFADQPPSGHGQIYDEIRMGTPQPRYSKRVVINPEIEMYWGAGKHEMVASVCEETFDPWPLKLLHFRWFGLESFLARNHRNWSVISQRNKTFGLGTNVQPGFAGLYDVGWFEEMRRNAIQVVD